MDVVLKQRKNKKQYIKTKKSYIHDDVRFYVERTFLKEENVFSIKHLVALRTILSKCLTL